MLAAERHKKISPGRPANERMEDVLTSHVFSLYRYFNNWHLQADFLRCAVNLGNNRLCLGNLKSARVVFWPKFSLGAKRREADVLLIVEEENGEVLVLLLEAKHESGLHNVEEDAEAVTEEGIGSSGHQLADEYLALSSAVWHLPSEVVQIIQKASRRLLLYVTAHFELPIPDLTEAVEIACTALGVGGASPQPASDIYWVSWRDLHALLVRAASAEFPGYSPGERNFLEDLRNVLAQRRLHDYQPFLELQAVDAYERLIRSSPPFEHLKLVDAYERLVQPPAQFEQLESIEPYQSIFEPS